jgi:hypothetical protein
VALDYLGILRENQRERTHLFNVKKGFSQDEEGGDGIPLPYNPFGLKVNGESTFQV